MWALWWICVVSVGSGQYFADASVFSRFFDLFSKRRPIGEDDPTILVGYPQIVELFYRDSHYCSMVVISAKSALTASHCVLENGTASVLSQDLFSVNGFGKVSQIKLRHENQSASVNNIAIVTFTDEFPLSPANLAEMDQLLTTKLLEIEVVKKIESGPSNYSYTTAKALTTVTRSSKLEYRFEADRLNLQLSPKGLDLGGPSFADSNLVGIHVGEGMDVNVAYYSSWIKHNMVGSKDTMYKVLYKVANGVWSPHCGLTMISARTALTAATCFVTEVNTTADTELYKVNNCKISKFIPHVNYTNVVTINNIGLVIFAHTCEGEIATLPSLDKIISHKDCIKELCGIGEKESGSKTKFSLREKTVAISVDIPVDHTFLIESNDRCDEGGPLLVGGTIFGVRVPRLEAYKETYTTVSKHVQWIKQYLLN